LVPTNFPPAIEVLDIPISGTNVALATNFTTISTVSAGAADLNTTTRLLHLPEVGTITISVWKDSAGQSLRTRLAFIQVAGCNFEFSLTASTDQFAAVLPAFTAFLTSFQEAKPQEVN